jgi:NadR type nicotinamide-nucleotide adenylyltransferase
MKAKEIYKIVVLGPESTGKSTLCKSLSHHYHSLWCPEYAREFLTIHGKNYSYEDLLVIAHGQIKMEDEYISQAIKHREQTGSESNLLFIDTNMYVMKVWCEFVFGNCHQWIIDQIVARPYDLYLLCNTDLPWVADDLREYPDDETRKKLYHHYKDLLVNQDVPWKEIGGTNEERVNMAIRHVDEFILTHSPLTQSHA